MVYQAFSAFVSDLGWDLVIETIRLVTPRL